MDFTPTKTATTDAGACSPPPAPFTPAPPMGSPTKGGYRRGRMSVGGRPQPPTADAFLSSTGTPSRSPSPPVADREALQLSPTAGNEDDKPFQGNIGLTLLQHRAQSKQQVQYSEDIKTPVKHAVDPYAPEAAPLSPGPPVKACADPYTSEPAPLAPAAPAPEPFAAGYAAEPPPLPVATACPPADEVKVAFCQIHVCAASACQWMHSRRGSDFWL